MPPKTRSKRRAAATALRDTGLPRDEPGPSPWRACRECVKGHTRNPNKWYPPGAAVVPRKPTLTRCCDERRKWVGSGGSGDGGGRRTTLELRSSATGHQASFGHCRRSDIQVTAPRPSKRPLDGRTARTFAFPGRPVGLGYRISSLPFCRDLQARLKISKRLAFGAECNSLAVSQYHNQPCLTVQNYFIWERLHHRWKAIDK